MSMNWFTRSADDKALRETVSLPVPAADPQFEAMFELRVRFDDKGQYVYEPETSIISAKAQNPSDGQWYDMHADDVAALKADKATMDAMYGMAVAEDAGKSNEIESDPKTNFENSTTAQIGTPYELVKEWWKTVSEKDRLERLRESGILDQYLDKVSDAVAGLTMLDVKSAEPEFYNYMRERQLEGGGRRKKAPAAPAPAPPAAAAPSETPPAEQAV